MPFQRDSSVAKMFAHMNDPAPPITDMVPILPSALDEVVRRAMAKDPADRYPSAGDFGRAAVAAAAGGALAVPERTVAVGEAAPADATRASAQPDQTVRSPEPKLVDTVSPPPPEPHAPAPATPAAPAGLPPQPPPPREAARGGGVNWGLVIAGIVVLLLAGGAVAAVLGGVFEGDKESSNTGVRDGGAGPEVTDESATEPEAKTERSQIEELERRVGDEQKPGTSTAPAPSTSESPGSSPESGGASSASVTACGAAGSVFEGQVRIANVTTRNVPCQTAREFAAGFETTSGAETDFRCSEDASCTWRGWTCRNDGRQARSIDHRCEKGDRVVRWQARST